MCRGLANILLGIHKYQTQSVENLIVLKYSEKIYNSPSQNSSKRLYT